MAGGDPGLGGDGLTDPLSLPLGMMCTPALAAVIVTFWLLKPAHPARFLGLTPVFPVGRSVRFALLSLLVPPMLVALAGLLGVAGSPVDRGTSPEQLATLAILPLFCLVGPWRPSARSWDGVGS